jgi:hypothetical protein
MIFFHIFNIFYLIVTRDKKQTLGKPITFLFSRVIDACNPFSTSASFELARRTFFFCRTLSLRRWVFRLKTKAKRGKRKRSEVGERVVYFCHFLNLLEDLLF